MLEGIRDKLKWLDPFTYVDLYVMPVVNPKKDKNIETVVYVISAFVFAFVLYNFILAGILGTSSPLVIVYSGSMEPVLYRGDVVILTSASDLQLREASVDFPVRGKEIRSYAQIGSRLSQNGRYRDASVLIGGEEFEFDEHGPIIVYYSPDRRQDIIHRAVLGINAPDGYFILTMGDNNNDLDQDCPNCITRFPVDASTLKGKYLFHLPLIGHVKLFFFDDLPWILNCALTKSGSFFRCASTLDPVERQLISAGIAS